MAYILQQSDDEEQNAAQQNALASAASNTATTTTAPIAGSGSTTASNAAATPVSNSTEASSTAPASAPVPELQANTTNVSAGASTGDGGATATTVPTNALQQPGGSGTVVGGGTTTQQAAPAVATYGTIQSLNADQATQLANAVAQNSVTQQSQNLTDAQNQANSQFQGEIAPDNYNLTPTTESFINNALTSPASLDSTDESQFQSYLNGYTGPTTLSTDDTAPLTTAQAQGDQYFQNLNTDSGAQAALQSLYQQTMNGQTPSQGESAFDAMLLQNNAAVQPIFNTAQGTFDTTAGTDTSNLTNQAAQEVASAQANDTAVQNYLNSQYGTTNQNFENTINSAVTSDQQAYQAQQTALTNYLSSLNTPAGTLTRVGGADNTVPNAVAPTYDAAGVPEASAAELSALGLTQAQLDSLVSAEQGGTTINPLTYLNTTAPTYNPNTVATADQVAYYNALQSLMNQPNTFLNEPGTPGGTQSYNYNNALAAANVQPTVNPTVNGTTGDTGTGTGTNPTTAVTAGAALGALSGVASIISIGGKLYNAINGQPTTPFTGTAAQAATQETADQQAADAATADQQADETAAGAYSAPDVPVDGSAPTDLSDAGFDADGNPIDEYGDITNLNQGGATSTAGSTLGTVGQVASVAGAVYSVYNLINGYQSGATGQDTINGAEAGAAVSASFAAYGATIGSVVPVVGTIIGAVIGAAVGALSSVFGGGKADPEQAIANNYTAAITSDGPAAASQATPQQNFEALAGYFDAKNNTPGHSEPVEQVFGRMQEGPFLSDLMTQVNAAITSGKLPPNATAAQAYSSVILPYINSKGATISTTPGSEGIALTTSITNLIGQWMSGQLTGSTAIGISGQTMGSQAPAYVGQPPAPSTPLAVQQEAAPANSTQALLAQAAANPSSLTAAQIQQLTQAYQAAAAQAAGGYY